MLDFQAALRRSSMQSPRVAVLLLTAVLLTPRCFAEDTPAPKAAQPRPSRQPKRSSNQPLVLKTNKYGTAGRPSASLKLENFGLLTQMT